MKTEECILCRGDRRSILHDLKEYAYMRCSGCGLVSLSPAPDPEILTGIYAGSGGRAVDPAVDPTGEEDLFLHRFRGELDRIETFSPAGRILDIGSAWGFFLHVCRESGWDAWGVEPGRAESEYARRRFGLPVVTGLLADARFQTGSFDVVTLWHVLEHMPEPVAELGEIRRVLRPGGLLVISVPTNHSVKDFDYGPVPLHCWYFGRRTLRRLVASAGYHVLQIVGSGGTGAVRALRKIGMHRTAQTFTRHHRVLSPVRKAMRAAFSLVRPEKEITLYARSADSGKGGMIP